MRYKIVTTILVIVLCFSLQTDAQDLNLNKYSSETFDELAEITGQVLGSGLYHTGSVHKFGGFDVGVKTMIGFLTDSEKVGPFYDTNIVPLPAIQANIGLFDHFEVGGRLVSYRFGTSSKEEINLVSGIVKYKVLGGIGLPDIASYAAWSRLSGITDFSLNTVTLGAVISYGIPFISAYAGANYNVSRLEVDLEPDNQYTQFYPNGFSEDYRKNMAHLTVGANMAIAPFTRLNAEYNIGKINTVTVGIVLSLF